MSNKEGVIDFCHLLNEDFYLYNTNQKPMIFKPLELSLLKDAYDLYIIYQMPDYLHYLYMIYNN